MRELKFRYFDRKTQSMHSAERIDFKQRIVFLNEIKGDEGQSIRECHFISHPNDLMQYTGLKDKTDKEIYEGDIVQYPTGFKEQVEFNDYGFWNIYDNVGNLEIIGTIHEHPHLLEKL